MNFENRDIKWLKATATREFNKKIRERDADHSGIAFCISCGKPIKLGTKEYQAGHFYPGGNFPNLIYNTDNVHVQCLQCNYFKHSNALMYRQNLIQKIGVERVERLDILAAYHKRHGFKWDRFYLIDIIKRCRNNTIFK